MKKTARFNINSTNNLAYRSMLPLRTVFVFLGKYFHWTIILAKQSLGQHTYLVYSGCWTVLMLHWVHFSSIIFFAFCRQTTNNPPWACVIWLQCMLACSAAWFCWSIWFLYVPPNYSYDAQNSYHNHKK